MDIHRESSPLNLFRTLFSRGGRSCSQSPGQAPYHQEQGRYSFDFRNLRRTSHRPEVHDGPVNDYARPSEYDNYYGWNSRSELRATNPDPHTPPLSIDTHSAEILIEQDSTPKHDSNPASHTNNQRPRAARISSQAPDSRSDPRQANVSEPGHVPPISSAKPIANDRLEQRLVELERKEELQSSKSAIEDMEKLCDEAWGRGR